MTTVRDVIIISVILTVLGLILLSTSFIVNTSMTKLVNNTKINESQKAVDVFNATKNITSRYDYIFFAFFMGMIFFTLIIGWFVGGNPLFMFIYMLLTVIGIVISAVLSNAWEIFSTKATFAVILTTFPITNHILLNLPIYITIIGVINIIVMFAKPMVSEMG
jgi:hypothetical protein